MGIMAEADPAWPLPPVSLEALKMEVKARRAGECLQNDNRQLHRMAVQAQVELEEEARTLNEHLIDSVQAESVIPTPIAGQFDKSAVHAGWAAYLTSEVPTQTAEDVESSKTPALDVFREIATVQNEVCCLAKENAVLVEKMAKMRAAIESKRCEQTPSVISP